MGQQFVYTSTANLKLCEKEMAEISERKTYGTGMLPIDNLSCGMYDQITKYSQSILNFRMGIRRNNQQLIHSAKWMSKGLFHGRKHPIIH